MGQWHLIRTKMAYETESYYEEKTDVWLMGDVAGYRSLQAAIAKATDSRQIVVPRHARKSNSMRLCILPPASTPARVPRLKLVERIVFLSRTPEMELIIYGNRMGYRWLDDCLTWATAESLDDPSEHLHLDDHLSRRVVRRSVSLNIRGALSEWSRKGLRDYASLVFDRQATSIPPNIGYLSKKSFPYETPVAGEQPFALR